MLILLPLVWFLACWSWQSARVGELRRAFLLTTVLWAGVLSVMTELLSLLRGLTPTIVAAGWLIAFLPVLILGVRKRSLPKLWASLAGAWDSLPRVDRLLALALGAVLSVLLLIAVVSPPNNVDSFLYHMSRVMHWQQNASLRPYPALIDHQLNKPIWAETAILHLRMLWGDDRPAALVQWFSMIGSLVAVSAIADLLGASRRVQILAAWLCASIPMGILQATSTQNDYVAAYWSVVMALLVVLASRRPLDRLEVACLGLTTGLGMLTKGTFFVYAPPLLAWYALVQLRNRRVAPLARHVAGIGVLVMALNAGFWIRNIMVYGGPYGTSEWLAQNLGLAGVLEPGPGGDASATPEGPLPSAELSDAPQQDTASTDGGQVGAGGMRRYAQLLAWTAGRNLTFPLALIQSPVIGILEAWAGVFGPEYAAEIAASAWNHEDHAGNPLHLALVPVGLGFVLARPRMPRRLLVLAYMVAALGTFLLLPVVIGHGASYWGIRYQLPFFVLWAPAAAVAVAGIRAEAWGAVGAVLLALYCMPWVLLNNTRPLVGMPPWPTRTRSILVEDPVRVLLATNPGLVDDYQMTASAIRQVGCTQIGLNAGSDFLEYPLWWLLEAPQSGVRIEVLNTDVRLQPFADASFTPCALVCAQCDGYDVYGMLRYAGQYDSIRLFSTE